MKKLLLVILFLTGCTCQPVKVAVWTPPKIDIPARPVLTSDGVGIAGQIARKNSNDLILMRGYAFKLENILYSIQSQSGVPSTELKTIEINK